MNIYKEELICIKYLQEAKFSSILPYAESTFFYLCGLLCYSFKWYLAASPWYSLSKPLTKISIKWGVNKGKCMQSQKEINNLQPTARIREKILEHKKKE